MFRGIVKAWDAKKGFGFIRPVGGEKDVFCHYSGIDPKYFSTKSKRNLQEDQFVEFQIVPGAKGPIATNVRVVTP